MKALPNFCKYIVILDKGLLFKPIINWAFWTAALVQSTPGPNEQNP